MRSTLRGIGILVAVVTALGALAFALLYMARWEWHRALVAGIAFVGAEVGVGIIMILRRLDGMAEPRERRRPPDTPPVRHDPVSPEFPWLSHTRERHGVFVPILLGGGVLVTAVTWLIEKVSSGAGSSRPAAYERFSFPDRPLSPTDTEMRVRELAGRDDDQLRALLGPFATRQRSP